MARRYRLSPQAYMAGRARTTVTPGDWTLEIGALEIGVLEIGAAGDRARAELAGAAAGAMPRTLAQRRAAGLCHRGWDAGLARMGARPANVF